MSKLILLIWAKRVAAIQPVDQHAVRRHDTSILRRGSMTRACPNPLAAGVPVASAMTA